MIDFWSPELHEIYSNIQGNFKDRNPQNMFVLGKANSGKTFIISQALEELSQEKKKSWSIVKVSFDNALVLENLYGTKQATKLQNWQFTLGPAIPGVGVGLSLPIDQFINKILERKKKNIIWFDDISLTSALSLEKVLSIIDSFSERKISFIFDSTEGDVYKRLNKHFNNSLIQINLPLIKPDDYANHFLKSNSKIDYIEESLFSKMQKYVDKTGKKADDLIKVGEGSYGNIEVIVDSAPEEISDISTLVTNILGKAGLTENRNDLYALLLLFVLSNGLATKDWVEKVIEDKTLDFVKKLDELQSKEFIKVDNEKIALDKKFDFLKKQFIEFGTSKTVLRKTSKVIDVLLKKQAPENYLLRYHNAKYFNVELAQEYLFLYLKNDNNQVLTKIDSTCTLSRQYLEIRNLLTEATKNEVDYKINIGKLNKINVNTLPLLIRAEYLAARLSILLGIPYNNRRNYRAQIEILLHKMVEIFERLEDSEENEEAIKIGLLLAPEMINYLSEKDVPKAIKIYSKVEKLINQHLYINFNYYRYYDIIYRIKSTSILSVRESNFLLKDMLEQYNQKDSFELLDNINTQDLIPQIFSNILGLSFFLTFEEIDYSLEFLKSNEPKIMNYSYKKYKIENNLLLAKFFDSSIELSSFVTEFDKLKDNHVATINYAGALFYNNQLAEAEKILQKLLEDEPYDGFYTFYGNYNLALINFFIDNSNKALYLLEQLEIPTLFTDVEIISKLDKKIGFLIYFIQNNGEKNLEALEKNMKLLLRDEAPISSKIWAFSDYQYWS